MLKTIYEIYVQNRDPQMTRSIKIVDVLAEGNKMSKYTKYFSRNMYSYRGEKATCMVYK